MAIQSSEASPLLASEKTLAAMPSFNSVETTKGKRPQAIAHRGYKAAYPENTMGAFKGAVEVGAHAIETDLHLSKDGIVVLSHDATLKRCFGEETKIADCDWEYLKELRTLKEPRQPMPRLKDLLEYLNTPGLEDIWVLLDIKLDDEATTMMTLIARTMQEVKGRRPWSERIMLGCWNAKYVPLCQKLLPRYPIAHIGWNIAYARQFLKVPNVHFNMLQPAMLGPFGAAFRRDVKKADRSLFLWTVNDEKNMRWCISKGIDGVITDDPKKYLELSESWKGGRANASLYNWAFLLVIWIMTPYFKKIFSRKFGIKMDQKTVCADLGIEDDSKL
ncbi:putative glycerophosphoryl diester phosphodiesterase [Mollisia scopiformis]|uniref:Putative glycerophosphoryl diester phosphodiesterase n=1 Tax=Mollisia scopiformis TaxID=149040 RepID=A0A194XDZ3_MOLSC|nr:putative glycerophosphoryl diester phosphodiesterase [Mollisia scopiformis]KUJ18405.1 putative glycerophosphoryl diester phosphodiesterase [Mollisia scopiformis]